MPGKRKSQKKPHVKKHPVKKHPVKKHHDKKHHAKKRVSKSKKQKGGKLNAFFKLMLDARKKDLSEFKYKDNTYKQFTAKTGLKLYKKA